ncbi:carbohydrate ABC transporter permease [Paenibacillus agaridevorans]|uniref:carbohydrate ABC transporter permease n=1 Tax=Paenibacillus agaridevorans TaxID=171404 RepID=UPI001BE46759|nr:sugar ABC transporter permease [Paenibacillus agaridevorans]
MKRLNSKEPYILLAPSFLLLLIFLLYPLLSSFLYAFQSYKLTAPNDVAFNGLDNFKAVFSDDSFGLVLRNSFIWVVLTVAGQFVFGFILALALRKPFPGRNLYQAIVFLPWAVSSFVVGLTFRWLLNAEYGPVNDLLLKWGIIEDKIYFLSDANLALFTVILTMTWYGIPFFAIMLLAAMQSIPDDLYEAADIDGAGIWSKFWNITFSYIKQTIILTLLLRTIWVFASADLIYIMTAGGPANSSNILSSYMFMKAYSTLDYGQASAIGLFFMALLILFCYLFMKATKFEKAGNF